MRSPELLCPAGSLPVLKCVVRYGADAVYLGGETFSLMTPSITQIDQSAKETAQNACAILMEMMTEGVPGRTVIIEPRLIAGESSAPKSC